MLRYAILGLICYKEMSGYDVIKRFEDSLKGIVYAQKSQVYLELKKLCEDGLVEVRREEQLIRPSKNVYTATEKGREALRQWLLEMDENTHFNQRLPFIVKIYFSANISEEDLLDSLMRFKKLTDEMREDVIRVSSHINNEHQDDEHFLYWEMCVDYCMTTCDAYSEWVDRCIEKIRKRTGVQIIA